MVSQRITGLRCWGVLVVDFFTFSLLFHSLCELARTSSNLQAASRSIQMKTFKSKATALGSKGSAMN